MSSSSSPQAQDISNCVSAPFDPVNNTSPGSWSFCYNQAQNTLAMTVNLSQPGAIIDAVPLVSTIDSDGLKDMLEFLYQVNMRMQQANKN